ncbi:hypothetical protein BKA58DRAFT_432640 [Alternaria rosae]|uniref:uncharacterized protein n=1 Tax=Alternaria rosae TaxID=1187941 RepID=UPI001E8CC561|nr:uncharacterized protein BKA58DRAFT_432640 [Alternaria rosae]KAH6852857.1 hypothetical protein BKA58DRAFT_432640 [Alternaria rosae]
MSPQSSLPVVSAEHVVDTSRHTGGDTAAIATSTQYDALKYITSARTEQQDDEPQDDTVSETNTVLYGQEPFETLQHKVVELAAKVFRRSPQDISVHEMKGGSFNRVVSVTLSTKPKSFSWIWFTFRCLSARKKKATTQCESYIVRVPRMMDDGDNGAEAMAEDMKRQVAVLKTAISRLPLPTPDVESYDITMENIFGRPYMIQKRLPGENLAGGFWRKLNIQQKRCMAKQITALASTIASVEGPAGDIASRNLSCPSKSPINIDTFYTPPYDDQPSSKPTSSCKPLDFLLERCEQYRAYDAFEGVNFDEVWVSFARISKALEARGFLDGPCVLVHGDLKPYNILAEVRSDTEAVITGVIDWDSAIIAPEFMAYRAPFWLWTPEEMNSDEEDKEWVAVVEPNTEEDRIMKQVFLDNASEKFKRFAFPREAMMARRMFEIIQKGMPDEWEHEEAQGIIMEWDDLHPEDDVRYQESVVKE